MHALLHAFTSIKSQRIRLKGLSFCNPHFVKCSNQTLCTVIDRLSHFSFTYKDKIAMHINAIIIH